MKLTPMIKVYMCKTAMWVNVHYEYERQNNCFLQKGKIIVVAAEKEKKRRKRACYMYVSRMIASCEEKDKKLK